MEIAGRANPRTMETFTIPEAAAAIGKSLSNFRRWVTSELVPAPFLKETAKGWYVYNKDELLIMQRILAEHEREFVYLSARNTEVINQIHQAIYGYRDITFGYTPTRGTP